MNEQFIYDDINPIQSVDGQAIPIPQHNGGYNYSLNPINGPDAGRTEDMAMDTMLMGHCVKLQLKWRNVTAEDGARIFKAFFPQYVTVTYYDAMAAGYKTSVFYAGTPQANMYSMVTKVRWTDISVDLIEKDGVKV